MLDTFFMELFNYCFPSDYRMKLREKLEHTYQNEKTAIHYAHEIQGLFNIIGNIRQGDKVLKLWRGLRMEIQQGLWRDKLNLDYNTWDEVLTVQVEHIEMSLKTASSRGSGKKSTPLSFSGNAPQVANSGSGSGRSSFRKFIPHQFRQSSHNPPPNTGANPNQPRQGSSRPEHRLGPHFSNNQYDRAKFSKPQAHSHKPNQTN